MKSKVLIKLLQQEDPTGEGEVLVGNQDIFYLEWKPGYWDGCYHLLVRDEKKKPYYDIVGAEYRSDGWKLCIRSMDTQDVLADNPDAPVKVVDDFVEKKMQNQVDKWRAEIKEIKCKIEQQLKEIQNEQRT